MSLNIFLLWQSFILLLLIQIVRSETAAATTSEPIETDVLLLKSDNNSTDVDTDAKWCPIPGLGSKCPRETIFYHYNCCGTTNDQCCFFMNSWVIVSLAIIFLLFVTAMVTAVLSCVFSEREENEK